MPAPFPSRGFRRTRERASGLLLAFGVDDLNATLPTGQTLVSTRASGRTVFDSAGRVATIAHSQLPWSSVYNAEEAVWEPVLDSQPGSTNLCLQSENFGTTWAAIGTPARTAAAATCGDLVLDLLDDNGAGALEGYSQAITFTANAVKAVSIFLKAGTSTSTVIRLRDTTAGANRLLQVITWSGGVPTVTATTGTHIATTACYGGVYRFQFQTTSVTAANANQIEVYPATTSGLATGNTGTVYAGGVQCENRLYPTSYIKTTTATVTTQSDLNTVAIAWDSQDFTVYARTAYPYQVNQPSGGQLGILGMGTADPKFYLAYTLTATAKCVAYVRDSVPTAGGALQNIPATSFVDICAQYVNMQTAPQVRLDVGGGFGALSTAVAAIPAFATLELSLGAVSNAPTDNLQVGLRRLLIASGARTLEQMRGLAV